MAKIKKLPFVTNEREQGASCFHYVHFFPWQSPYQIIIISTCRIPFNHDALEFVKRLIKASTKFQDKKMLVHPGKWWPYTFFIIMGV